MGTDRSHHLVAVPGGPVQQALDLVGGAVADPFGDGPPVALGQLRQDGSDVAGGGQPRQEAGKALTYAFHEGVEVVLGLLGVYHQGSGRPWLFSFHTATIFGRPSLCLVNRSQNRVDQRCSPRSHHKVRLPYRARVVYMPDTIWPESGPPARLIPKPISRLDFGVV